jgi:NADH:ubiquinone reductase (H+-translocating)
MGDTIYVLGHSQTEIRRLIKQMAILQATTERLLRSAGIERGMRVLDLGCGAGDVAMLAGKLVGASGSVVGIDGNAQILAVARKRGRAYRMTERQRDRLPPTLSEVATMHTREPLDDEALRHIVIVGGGAAGLELVTRLGDRLGRRGRARITLVECARTHLWKPMLHAVAAGSIDPGEYEVSYPAQAHWHGFRYRFGEMVGLDRTTKQVRLAAMFDDEGRQITPPRSVRYDTLVIAIGSVTNDFGTPGVAEHAVQLETPAQAERFNRLLVNACIRAQTQEDPVRVGQLHVAIIGAGATGTELAAELHRTTREVVAYGLDRIDPERDIRILLVEAADRVLPGLPKRISEAAHRLLGELGVEVRTGARVTKIAADGVRLADGSFVRSELVIWTAGVKAPEVLRDLDGLEVNRINQLVVEPTLRTTRDPDIFAVGDCAACPRPGKPTPVPPRAQAAHQEAAHMVQQIERQLRGKPLLPYTYRDFGSLVSLGNYSTVGSLMGFLSGRSIFVEGLFARAMYRSLRIMHEWTVNGVLRTALGLLARGLSRRTGPQVKLH